MRWLLVTDFALRPSLDVKQSSGAPFRFVTCLVSPSVTVKTQSHGILKIIVS